MGKLNVVVVMTYFNRQMQVEHTLKSIARSKHKNIDIVVVDDKSDKIIDFTQYGKNVHVYRVGEEKWWTNSVVAYNLGIHEALKLSPDVIILQNAECYHYGDVISYAVNHLTNENYIAFSALALDMATTFAGVTDRVIKKLLPVNYAYPENPENEGIGWYNHPVLIPRAYDFCAAITTENLVKLNGYDERFARYAAYGDNDLILRVRRLGLRVVIPEDPFVVHQWHDHSHLDGKITDDMGLSLFQKIESKETGYRAVHTNTRDLCAS